MSFLNFQLEFKRYLAPFEKLKCLKKVFKKATQGHSYTDAT